MGHGKLGIVSVCIPPFSTVPVEHRHQVVFSGPQPQDLVLLPQAVPPARPQVHVVLHTFQASPQECHPLLSWSVSFYVKITLLFAFFHPKFWSTNLGINLVKMKQILLAAGVENRTDVSFSDDEWQWHISELFVVSEPSSRRNDMLLVVSKKRLLSLTWCVLFPTEFPLKYIQFASGWTCKERTI